MKKLLAVAAITCSVAQAQQFVPHLKRGGDSTGSNWNYSETTLTQASVAKNGVTMLPKIPLNGFDKRGAEGQPMLFTNVKGVNLLIGPTMSNHVRAVDAWTGNEVWSLDLPGMPVNGTTGNGGIDLYGINDHWGCLSSAVGDASTNRMYVDCQVSPDGSGRPETSRYVKYTIDVATGKVVAQATFAGMMHDNDSGAMQDFNAQMRKLRASPDMVVVGGRKFIINCGGSVYMTKPGVTGFCSAYDVATNTFTDFIATTQGRAANVWMSGSKVTVLKNGHIVFVTATGGFDALHEFGESIIDMEVSPTGELSFVDHWTPYRDRVRTGQDPQNKQTASVSRPMPPKGGVDGMPVMVSGANPSTGNFGPQDVPVNGHSMSMENIKIDHSVSVVDPITKDKLTLQYPSIAAGCWADEDAGSGPATCLEEYGYCVFAGKDGIAYSVKIGNMGQTSIADLSNPKLNCKKLAAYPIFATAYTGQDPCPTNDQALNFLVNNTGNPNSPGVTVHDHSAPVKMQGPDKQWYLFFGGENMPIKKYLAHPDGSLTFVAESQVYASENVRRNPGGGMTGSWMAGSSNGLQENSYILAASIPLGDANKTVTQGKLYLFDPVHTSDGIIHVIWPTQNWQNNTYTFNKFMPPFIDGGTIFLPDYDNSILRFR